MSCVEREKETAYVPKNVKQIGEPSRERKIYVEDYVITYINRIFMGNRETEKVLLLFGGEAVEKGCNYIYIRGACQVKPEDHEHKGKYFSGEDFQSAMEEGRKFFKNMPLIGWALIRKGQPMSLEERMRNTWEAYMSRIPIFLLGDAEEKEEIFYWKYDGRVKVQPGYYVFYEKNRAMQEYMIEKKSDGKQAGEKEEDFLVDSLRERLEERKIQDRKQSGKMLYAVSGFLFLVVLAIGVTLLNSNEKIAAIQTSVDSLLESLAESETRQLETKQKENTVDASLQEGDSQKETAATAPREIATTEPVSSTAATTESTTTTTSTTAESVTESTTASADEAAETVNKKPVSHIVGKGETLESISRDIYGTTSMVNEICKKNNITNPNAIFVGQEILLP